MPQPHHLHLARLSSAAAEVPAKRRMKRGHYFDPRRMRVMPHRPQPEKHHMRIRMIVLVRYSAGSQILAKSSSELLRQVEKRSSEKASMDLQVGNSVATHRARIGVTTKR